MNIQAPECITQGGTHRQITVELTQHSGEPGGQETRGGKSSRETPGGKPANSVSPDEQRDPSVASTDGSETRHNFSNTLTEGVNEGSIMH
jgi:hypothetical protein